MRLLSARRSPMISAQVGEWLKPTDCKSVPPCEVRRFESFPVHHFNCRQAVVTQLVEHFLGKEEVTGSIPVNGSKSGLRMIRFERFLSESAQQGHTNLLFERGMYYIA